MQHSLLRHFPDDSEQFGSMVKAPDSGSSPSAVVWEVRALCLAIADQLHTRFNPVCVRGEISGLSRAASGHCYFSLQDASATALLRCVMFKRTADRLDFAMRNGLEVELTGRIGIYEARGDLQLVVEQVQLAGAGALMERFMALKNRLTAEGLFDSKRKRPIVRSPRRIGIATSLGAAALQDVCTTLGRRVAHIPVLIAPAPVQGPDAAPQLVHALNRLQNIPDVDVILLVRGGGSMEDLWPFNEEVLVRAVAQSSVPVISGVGHETDFTLCDFAADLRAPTPTAAAELCATARSEWLAAYAFYAQQIPLALRMRCEKMEQQLDMLAQRVRRPSHFITQRLGHLDTLAHRLRSLKTQALQRPVHTLDLLQTRLHALSPERTLERGFALLTDEDSKPLSLAKQFQPEQTVFAQLQDGKIRLRVSDSQV